MTKKNLIEKSDNEIGKKVLTDGLDQNLVRHDKKKWAARNCAQPKNH